MRWNRIWCTAEGELQSYDATGAVAGQVGPRRSVQKLCLPTYRIDERDGVVFLWNGGGEPDHLVPDFYQHYGVDREKYFTVTHRLYMPFPARRFAENIPDAMHLAFAHGAAEWGEALPIEETDSMIRIENRLYNYRPWFTWGNVRRLYRQGELINFITPVRGSLFATTFGATVTFNYIENTGDWGNHITCWTPVGENDHHFFAVDVVPRPRVPYLEPVLRKALTSVLRLGVYSTAAQDYALLNNRREPAKPAYARFDKGLIAFRRHWDGRIEAGGDAHGIWSNGAGAVRASEPREEVGP